MKTRFFILNFLALAFFLFEKNSLEPEKKLNLLRERLSYIETQINKIEKKVSSDEFIKNISSKAAYKEMLEYIESSSSSILKISLLNSRGRVLSTRHARSKGGETRGARRRGVPHQSIRAHGRRVGEKKVQHMIIAEELHSLYPIASSQPKYLFIQWNFTSPENHPTFFFNPFDKNFPERNSLYPKNHEGNQTHKNWKNIGVIKKRYLSIYLEKNDFPKQHVKEINFPKQTQQEVALLFSPKVGFYALHLSHITPLQGYFGFYAMVFGAFISLFMFFSFQHQTREHEKLDEIEDDIYEVEEQEEFKERAKIKDRHKKRDQRIEKKEPKIENTTETIVKEDNENKLEENQEKKPEDFTDPVPVEVKADTNVEPQDKKEPEQSAAETINLNEAIMDDQPETTGDDMPAITQDAPQENTESTESTENAEEEIAGDELEEDVKDELKEDVEDELEIEDVYNKKEFILMDPSLQDGSVEDDSHSKDHTDRVEEIRKKAFNPETKELIKSISQKETATDDSRLGRLNQLQETLDQLTINPRIVSLNDIYLLKPQRKDAMKFLSNHLPHIVKDFGAQTLIFMNYNIKIDCYEPFLSFGMDEEVWKNFYFLQHDPIIPLNPDRDTLIQCDEEMKKNPYYIKRFDPKTAAEIKWIWSLPFDFIHTDAFLILFYKEDLEEDVIKEMRKDWRSKILEISPLIKGIIHEKRLLVDNDLYALLVAELKSIISSGVEELKIIHINLKKALSSTKFERSKNIIKNLLTQHERFFYRSPMHLIAYLESTSTEEFLSKIKSFTGEFSYQQYLYPEEGKILNQYF